MELTYSGHTNSHIIVVLADGESLGDRNGPDAFSVPVDGTNAVCRDIWRQGLEIVDPAASVSVAEALAAKAAKAAQVAEAGGRMTDEEKDRDRVHDEVVTAMYPSGPGVYHIEPPPTDAVVEPPVRRSRKRSED